MEVGSPWRMWTCYLRCRAWEGFTLVTVDVRIQVQGPGVLVTLETVVVVPQYRVREVGKVDILYIYSGPGSKSSL